MLQGSGQPPEISAQPKSQHTSIAPPLLDKYNPPRMMMWRLPNGGLVYPMLLRMFVLILFQASTVAAIAGPPTLTELRQEFEKPPEAARPWVYWFWMDENISRSGITADLEAMQRVGLGGVILFDVSDGIPAGSVRLGSTEWHELFKHTIAEAARLKLQVSVHNAPGYTSSGGPWITPDQAMQRLVFSKTNLIGPSHFSGRLPDLPEADQSHPIATLAFPTLLGDGKPLRDYSPSLTTSEANNPTVSHLLDAHAATVATLRVPGPGRPEFIQLSFAQPYQASVLRLSGAEAKQSFQGVLQVSDDGKTFRSIREFTSVGASVTLGFEPVVARIFRVLFTQADPALKHLTFDELELEPQHRIKLHQAKSGLGAVPEREAGQRNDPQLPAEAFIDQSHLVDLTAQTDSSGALSWEVPAGGWTVLRLGYAPIGTLNRPATPGGVGLESDKLSRQATLTHFNGYLAKLIADAGPATGPVLSGVHIDSWEVKYQNWTPHFPAEFQKRRGYDLRRYLPTMTGRFITRPEISERFLWDIRRTVADLLADNYASCLAELVHAHGLKLSVQGYTSLGGGPFDDLVYGGRADVPMTEFWFTSSDPTELDLHPMASAAHAYGRPIVAAEAFTSMPIFAAWREHPFALKPLGDAAFCEGVNHFAIHRYAHQPWPNRRPGMTMGPWGLHYERTQTWWEQSRAWHEYLTRCQFLLQQGLFAGDLCYLSPEGAYATPPPRRSMNPPVPAGYDYDLAPPEVVLERMSVQARRLVLPDGMSYAALILPDTDLMTPRLLRRIKEFVAAGATVIGPRPVRSPSLTDYPQCDRAVTELASELWGQCDGKTVTRNRHGQGTVIWGEPLPEVLKAAGLGPDFQTLTTIEGSPLRWIHRQVDGADIYFVANANPRPVQVECQFRVAGKTPEFWYPDDGHIEQPGVWKATSAATIVPLKLDTGGSIFVVFSTNATAPAPAISFTRDGASEREAALTIDADGQFQLVATKSGNYQVQTAAKRVFQTAISAIPENMTVIGPWKVVFPTNSSAPRTVMFPKLTSWTTHENPEVKYFSGTATYQNSFVLSEQRFGPTRKLFLNLGRVAVIAELRINGKACGILWKPPFESDISTVAHPGTNTIEIKVTNLWPNRLIGDEQLPPDCRWRDPAGSDSALVEWPAWFLAGQPSPTGRQTFSTWKHWNKDAPLLESGLLGPVTIRFAEQRKLQ